jgi:hypothetical protein
MLLSGIDASLHSCLNQVFSSHPVALAYLYGSVAAGRATPLSDVDIALVLIEGQYDPSKRLELELKIEDEIARTCRIGEIDVRAINYAPLMVRGEIVTKGMLLYSRDEDFRVDFETSTRSEYFDFLPLAAVHRQAFFEYLAKRGTHGQR